jgi:hypothetical protein
MAILEDAQMEKIGRENSSAPKKRKNLKNQLSTFRTKESMILGNNQNWR